VKPEVLEVKEEFLTKLNKHLFLLYTGKIRLARDLLQSVIRFDFILFFLSVCSKFE